MPPNNGIKLTSGGSSWGATRFAAVCVAAASWGAISVDRAACSLSRCWTDYGGVTRGSVR